MQGVGSCGPAELLLHIAAHAANVLPTESTHGERVPPEGAIGRVQAGSLLHFLLEGSGPILFGGGRPRSGAGMSTRDSVRSCAYDALTQATETRNSRPARRGCL